MQIGSGFSGFSQLMTGDVTTGTAGPGLRGPDGHQVKRFLWEWENDTPTNLGNKPYTSGVQIGSGFGGF